jgi:hypothetical protein
MFFIFHSNEGSKGISVGIATDYRLAGLGSVPSRGKRFFSSPSNEYWGFFPGGKAAEA